MEEGDLHLLSIPFPIHFRSICLMRKCCCNANVCALCTWRVYVVDRICVQVERIELAGSIVYAQIPMNDGACVFFCITITIPHSQFRMHRVCG